jgi:hypothetical protein
MIVASPRYKGRIISSFQEKFFPKFRFNRLVPEVIGSHWGRAPKCEVRTGSANFVYSKLREELRSSSTRIREAISRSFC